MRHKVRKSSSSEINIKPLSDTDFALKYADRVRHGKTRRDHANGYAARARDAKMKPIRCTSNHRTSGADNRGMNFWLG